MSKERELLKRVRDTLRELKETHYDLYWDIQAELDLDEQVPVAWMSTKGEGGLTDDSYYANHKDYVPLYLAPPKSEPFGPEIRERMSKAYNTKCEQIAFQEGIVFAEISHGIGVVE
jgi:hypothetical protein